MTNSANRFHHVAILGGGGLMGHGIALACLQKSDVEVTIISRKKATVQKGLDLVLTGPFGLERGVEKGKISPEKAEELKGKLHGTTDYQEGLAKADLVFESIPELVEVKQAMLVEAEKYAPPEAVFATNTSSITITELSAKLGNSGRLVGTHWFYPANVMPLVEVGRSELNEPETVEAVVDYLKLIGKKPVVVKDAPGFFMTRFINNFICEAIRLVELGVAGPAEVDEMVKLGLGWPMGVFELLDDTASIEPFYHAQQYIHENCGERYSLPPLAHKVFKAGYFGSPKVKPESRGGFYDFLRVPREAKAYKSS